MESKQDDFGYWAGWVAAFAIAAAFFVFVVWQVPSLKSSACAADETDCFRQWLSALGGWAALAAAIPSVLYLAKQISASDRHHKKSTALQLYRNRNLALHIAGYSNAIITQMEARRTLFVSGNSTDQQGLSALKMIDDMIFGFHFHAFEEQIEVPAMSLAFIRMQVEMTRPVLLAYANAGQWGRDTNDIVLGLLDTVIKYLRSCIISGEKYLYLTDQYAIKVLSSPD